MEVHRPLLYNKKQYSIQKFGKNEITWKEVSTISSAGGGSYWQKANPLSFWQSAVAHGHASNPLCGFSSEVLLLIKDNGRNSGPGYSEIFRSTQDEIKLSNLKTVKELFTDNCCGFFQYGFICNTFVIPFYV